MDHSAAEELGTLLPRVRGAVPGPRSSMWNDRLASVECPSLTARRTRRAEQSGADQDPIVWHQASGANVQDVDGNVYVDMVAGFGAALLGHSHPHVMAALRAQSHLLVHALGDVHPSEAKIALEQELVRLAPWPGAKVILGLSGSDAVEAALKTAQLATKRAGVLAFEGGYHGLSHGPLAACGYSSAFREPFAEQLNAHVRFVPYPAADRPEAHATIVSHARRALTDQTIGAVLVEPILGRGGVVGAAPGPLADIVQLAREAGAVVIADEIYVGLRRVNDSWSLAANRWPDAPDIVCFGKALGGGLPVSACVMRAEVAQFWRNSSGEAIHTSTFLGNPLGAACARATLDVLARGETSASRERVATFLWDRALGPLRGDPRSGVLGLGGEGLLVGVHLAGGIERTLRIVRAMLERGYIILAAGSAGRTGLSLTPPIALTDGQIDHFGRTLHAVLRDNPP